MVREEIVNILKSTSEEEAKALFAKAREARDKCAGGRIFMYGFVYFSTYCKNDCSFCFYRKDNKIDRYRKNEKETAAIAKSLVESGVHLIDLTLGEDEYYTGNRCQRLVDVVHMIKDELDTPVMVSPGVVPDDSINALADSGADFYALYQETHNRELFGKRRLNQSYDDRMHAKLHAASRGMLIEEGIMTGIGETAEDIADSIIAMGEEGASQMRAMSFIPQEGSPMEKDETPDRMLELKAIAIMRILYPHVLIPASLDVDGIEGLHDRLNAGANVVTSIIPPQSGCNGVAMPRDEIDEGGRTVEEAAAIIKDMGLTTGTKEELADYLKELKQR